jgi:glycyl-tRNA synthetase beta chain
MPNFLLEIGVEEIPDWMIEPALADLRAKFQSAFGAFGGSSIEVEATPRRLVLVAHDLIEQAPDVENVIQGPYLSAGAGAANGFAKKNGTTVEQLAKTTDAKGERYIFAHLVKGQSASEALAAKLPELITSITWPKTMFWTSRTGAKFIRPIRWIVALLDDLVVPFEVAGVKSGNTTRGHRILGSKTPVAVTVSNYFETLKSNFVIVKAEERWQRIEMTLSSDVEKDDALLQTLTYLTEFPNTIRGTFDPSYLELPKEILSTVMRHHQRYFSVLKPDGSLAPEFVAVTNTEGDPDGLIRQGNEKVLRARFNDARFFWQVDQQKKIIDRVPDLAKVTYQAKLGSYKDKTDRLQELALQLAAETKADATTVSQAALLSKTDLTTDMVKEFTELQGVVGGLYAKAQGEGEPVATAIYDHYKPVSMDDGIPRTLEGLVVALADKIDTLRECFRIGLVPTGSGDPFALRRAGQGVVKILFESRLNLALMPLIQDVPGLADFMKDRIQFYMKDVLELAYDEVAAAMAAGIGTLADLAERAEAIRKVRSTPDFEPLAASFKRIKNILKQAQPFISTSIDEATLTPGAEKDLYNAFVQVRGKIEKAESYQDKLAFIATLRPNVDLFFDKILVNDPDPAIRENRLSLLNSLLTEFSTIADFSEIVTQGANA